MSCYGCASSFGLFNKEHGCKNCGFAFCSKCLTKKIEIPKRKNEKHHVCNKCFDIISGKVSANTSQQQISPPEAYIKRMAALKERETSDSSSQKYQRNQNLQKAHYKKMSPAEREISERLTKLKEKNPNDVASSGASESEMRERLARLKGENPAIQTKENILITKPANKRTEQAQIDDLLDEIAAEVDLEAKMPDPVTEIEQRLAKLKEKKGVSGDASSGSDPSNNLNSSIKEGSSTFQQNITCKDTQSQTTDVGEISPQELKMLMDAASQELHQDAQKALEGLEKDKEIMKQMRKIKSRDKIDINKDSENDKHEESDSDNENEDVAAARIVNQLMEEDKLEEAAARDGIKINQSTKVQNTAEKYPVDDDELPYCIMCTEDATIRCHDCDFDLYCRRCWNESHVQFEMGDHRTSTYKAPKDAV